MNTELSSLSPPDAWQVLQQDNEAVLIDVRTSMEFEYVGHPSNAINLPWMEAPDWQINADFVEQVKTILQQKVPDKAPEQLACLLICRSGKRSEAAGLKLIESGFVNVMNVAEGFEGDRDGNKHRNTINGWRHHNLPWEQS